MSASTAAIGSLGREAEARDKSKLGKDEFTKLLLAQLSNQDPLSPMDSEAFVAQLAQFSTLEQMQHQTSSLEAILLAQAASNQTQAASLVGKDVTFNAKSIELSAQGKPFVMAHLEKDAASITAVVKDENGKVVRTLKLGGEKAGDVKVEWDGRDDKGKVMPEGTYTIEVTAADGNGKAVDVSQRSAGRITGVTFENGYAELLVGTRRVQMPDVVEIKEPTQNPASA